MFIRTVWTSTPNPAPPPTHPPSPKKKQNNNNQKNKTKQNKQKENKKKTKKAKQKTNKTKNNNNKKIVHSGNNIAASSLSPIKFAQLHSHRNPSIVLLWNLPLCRWT